jgi:hypothetical protein
MNLRTQTLGGATKSRILLACTAACLTLAPQFSPQSSAASRRPIVMRPQPQVAAAVEVHPPLRVIGGQLYDFTPAIQAHASGVEQPYFIQATAQAATPDGLLAQRLDGYEMPPTSSPSEQLLVLAAAQSLRGGDVRSFGAFDSGGQMMMQWMLNHPIYTPILIRDLTNGVPIGRRMRIFVLPAQAKMPVATRSGTIQAAVYFYGQATTNKAGFTNMFVVGPAGVTVRTINSPKR